MMSTVSMPGRRAALRWALLASVTLLLSLPLEAAATTRLDAAWSALVAAADRASAAEAIAGGFRLIVAPGRDGFPGGAFPRQHCRFLIAIEPLGDSWRGSVHISATAPTAVVTVRPAVLSPGLVGEVTVTPTRTGQERTIAVTITATRGDVSRQQVRTIEVFRGRALSRAWAADIRDRFVEWLERRHPELGITTDTPWTGGTPARPRWLIVMRYVFFTPDWEVGIEWHVTREPDDWAHLYLRHRWTELSPSFGAEITSVLRGDTPHSIAPPDELYR